MNFYKENRLMYLSLWYRTLLAPHKPLFCPFPVITSPKVTTTLTSKNRFPGKQTLRLPRNWDLYLWEGKRRGGKRRGGEKRGVK